MLGIQYKEEVADCYEAVRRVYAEIGIELRPYAFPQNFWDYGDDLYAKHFAREGFYEVDSEGWKPREYDVLFVPGSLTVSFPTHAGVIVEDGKVYHHYPHRLSELVDFKGVWRRPTRILRHKDWEPKAVKPPTPVELTELMPSHVRRRIYTKSMA